MFSAVALLYSIQGCKNQKSKSNITVRSVLAEFLAPLRGALDEAFFVDIFLQLLAVASVARPLEERCMHAPLANHRRIEARMQSEWQAPLHHKCLVQLFLPSVTQLKWSFCGEDFNFMICFLPRGTGFTGSSDHTNMKSES